MYYTLYSGTAGFQREIRRTEAKFESRPRKFDQMTFAGIEIIKSLEGYCLTQEIYARRMDNLECRSDYEDLISLSHKLDCLGHSRTDIIAPVNILSQISAKKFTGECVKSIKAIVRRVWEKVARVITHHILNADHLLMILFADLSLVNNADSSTQLGFIILISDDTDRSNGLHYSSYKEKCIVR